MHTLRCYAQLLGYAAVAVGAMGCDMESIAVARPASIGATAAVGTVTLSPRNAIVAVGGTVDIRAIPTDMTGAPLDAPDSVTYQLVSISDTIRMVVTKKNADTYTITGRAPSSGPMLLNMFVYKNNTVKADQAFIHVTDSVPTGPMKAVMTTANTTVLIRAQPTINTALVNVAGDTVMVPMVRYWPKGGDSAKVLTYEPGIIAPGNRGILLSSEYTYFFGTQNAIVAKVGDDSAYVYTDVNAYGTVLHDSLKFHFHYPSTATFGPFVLPDGYQIFDRTAINERTYQSPATLTFGNTMFVSTNGAPLPLDYVFDQPDKALATTPGGASGNILGLNLFSSQRRLFTTPGTYGFTVTVRGNTPPYTGQTYSVSFTIK